MSQYLYITENGKLKMENKKMKNSHADTTCNPFSIFNFQLSTI